MTSVYEYHSSSRIEGKTNKNENEHLI